MSLINNKSNFFKMKKVILFSTIALAAFTLNASAQAKHEAKDAKEAKHEAKEAKHEAKDAKHEAPKK